MFNEDVFHWDAEANIYLTREDAEQIYASKTEIPVLAGGLDVTLADARYAPKTGSTEYATVAQLPNISGKANTTDVAAALAAKADITDVATALSGKSDVSHTHPGVYAPVATTYNKTEVDALLSAKQPTGSYALVSQIPDISGKANTADVTAALATKSDTTHTHTGTYAPSVNPANGQNNYAGKDYVDAQIATRQVAGTYLTTDDDSAYETIVHAAATYATQTALTTGLAGKSDTSHTHTGLPTAILTNAVPTPISETTVHSSTRSDSLYFQKANVSTSGTVNSNSLVYSTSRANALFAPLANPANGQNNYAGKDYVDAANALLQTKANMVVVGPETTYYSGAKVDALLAGVSGAGLTKAQADTYYAPVTGSANYAAAGHTHATLPTAILTATGAESTTSVYASSYTQTQLDSKAPQATTYTKMEVDTALAGKQDTGSYALVSQIPDISGKANTADVTAALATKSDTTHTHTGTYAPNTNPANGQNNYAGKDYVDAANALLQTKANMLVTAGGETTYPSKAYADTLYAPIGSVGGGGAPMFVRCTAGTNQIGSLNVLTNWTFDSVNSTTTDIQVVSSTAIRNKSNKIYRVQMNWVFTFTQVNNFRHFGVRRNTTASNGFTDANAVAALYNSGTYIVGQQNVTVGSNPWVDGGALVPTDHQRLEVNINAVWLPQDFFGCTAAAWGYGNGYGELTMLLWAI